MLTIKNSFYKNITFEKFLNAYYKSIKGKENKKEILKFYLDLETNIINLMEEVRNFEYKTSEYREFIIYEPKRRVIRSLPFKDRVVQTWYVENFIKTYFVPRFIYDSYACINEKGTHKAVFRIQSFMRRMRKKYEDYYVVKFDIKHFFESIDKEILFEIIEKFISDKALLKFTYELINSDTRLGLPIGNYTSQYYANIYLNELDHYMKDVLHIPYVVRYMDDFVVLAKNKVEAREYFDLIDIFVRDKLNLELNKKSCYYPSRLGIDFCGYKVFEDYILIRKRCKNKIKRKIKIWNNFYRLGILDEKSFELSFNSFLGHISHANTYNLKCKVISEIDYLNLK